MTSIDGIKNLIFVYVASHDENGEEAFGEKVCRSGGRTAGENRREHRERSVAVSILLVVDNVDSLSPPPSPVVQLRRNPPSPLNRGKRKSGQHEKHSKFSSSSISLASCVGGPVTE